MKKLNNYLLILPCTIFILFTVGFGLINSLMQSLGFIPSLGMKDVSLRYYKELFRSADFLSSLSFTLKITLISSTLALIIGIALAYFVFYNIHTKRKDIFIKVPIIIPHIIASFIIVTLFSQSGMLSRVLFNLGLIKSGSNFPLLINDTRGFGIILTYIWKEAPFITLIMYNILSNINRDLIIAAKTLGASNAQIFLKILLPLCKQALISSYVIIFAFSFGAFEVPFLMGPTMPKTLSLMAFLEYTSADLFNRPYAMAINTVLSLISITLIYFYEYWFKRLLKNPKEMM